MTEIVKIDFLFTNSSLSMLLTLSLVLLAIVISKMEGASPSAKSRKRQYLSTATGGASGSGEGDDDEEKRRRLKKKISGACQSNFLKSLRELLIEIYAESLKTGGSTLRENEHSNRWNWAIKVVYEETYGSSMSQTFLDVRNISTIVSELSAEGPRSSFFKKVIGLLNSVHDSDK